jgi:hypothetical protein
MRCTKPQNMYVVMQMQSLMMTMTVLLLPPPLAICSSSVFRVFLTLCACERVAAAVGLSQAGGGSQQTQITGQCFQHNTYNTWVSTCARVSLFVCLFVCLSVCLFVCLSVCLFVCLCLSLQCLRTQFSSPNLISSGSCRRMGASPSRRRRKITISRFSHRKSTENPCPNRETSKHLRNWLSVLFSSLPFSRCRVEAQG